MFDTPMTGTYISFILQGLFVTLCLSVIALSAGSLLGFLGGAVRTSSHRRLSALVGAYVMTFRSVPVIIQLFLVFYGVPVILGISLNPFAASCAALAFYLGAYMTEIVRAGLESVPRGQIEAAQALGLSYLGIMRHVLGPQAMRVILPAWTGLVVGGIKDSSLASIIGVTELSRAALTVRANTFTNWDVFFVLAGAYFVVCSSVAWVGSRLERRWRIIDRTTVGAGGAVDAASSKELSLRAIDNI